MPWYPDRIAKQGDFARPRAGAYSDRVGIVRLVRDGAASVKFFDQGKIQFRSCPVKDLVVYKLAEEVELR